MIHLNLHPSVIQTDSLDPSTAHLRKGEVIALVSRVDGGRWHVVVTGNSRFSGHRYDTDRLSSLVVLLNAIFA